MKTWLRNNIAQIMVRNNVTYSIVIRYANQNQAGTILFFYEYQVVTKQSKVGAYSVTISFYHVVPESVIRERQRSVSLDFVPIAIKRHEFDY